MSETVLPVINVSQPRRKKRVWLRSIMIGMAILMLMMCALVAIPVISPRAGADMADTLRSIVGPEPVAALESLSFQVQDVFNRFRYQVSNQPEITFADSPAPGVSTAPKVAATPRASTTLSGLPPTTSAP